MQAFMRFFFQQLYTTLAWTYDLVANVTSVGQWRIWQKTGLEHIPPGRVLEIGYGTGHMLSLLSEQGCDVFGIDPSPKMSQIASRRLQKHAFRAALVRAKAQALPFKANEFQSILSTFPSDYIFDPFTLKEAWRVLNAQGVLIIIPGVQKIFGIKSGEKRILALLDEFASTLYRLTGEAIDPDNKAVNEFMKQLYDSGFSADIQHVLQKRAIVYRIIAKKET